jgi:integrase/recombinase XerD
MVKLKTVLDTRRAKSDGTFNILFRITNHKEVKYLPLGVSVKESQWDEKTASLNKQHPNVNSINTLISKQFYEIQKALVTLEDSYSFEVLKKILNPITLEVVKHPTFKQFGETIIADMIKVKRTGGAQVYLTAVNRLIGFTNNLNTTFEDIDYILLDRFKNSLLEQGLAKNSIGNYFRSIRALYNKAIKAKIVSRDLYPFHGLSIKTEKTAKRAIKVDELQKLYMQPKCNYSQEWHASNYLFLSFALRGISFTDMAYLKESNIKNGCIVYRRRKTQKLYTIKLHPVATLILEHYKGSNNGYLLPILPKDTVEDSVDSKKITRQWIKTTNKYLNRIALNGGVVGNITTYVIRHTWATIAKRLDYPNEMIAEAMGHEYGNKMKIEPPFEYLKKSIVILKTNNSL